MSRRDQGCSKSDSGHLKIRLYHILYLSQSTTTKMKELTKHEKTVYFHKYKLGRGGISYTGCP
jgi:hypothetical protein